MFADYKYGVWKGKTHHQEWRDEPIHHNAECNLDPDLPFSEYLMQSFELDFAQYRVHHNQQPDGFRRKGISTTVLELDTQRGC